MCRYHTTRAQPRHRSSASRKRAARAPSARQPRVVVADALVIRKAAPARAPPINSVARFRRPRARNAEFVHSDRHRIRVAEPSALKLCVCSPIRPECCPPWSVSPAPSVLQLQAEEMRAVFWRPGRMDKSAVAVGSVFVCAASATAAVAVGAAHSLLFRIGEHVGEDLDALLGHFGEEAEALLRAADAEPWREVVRLSPSLGPSVSVSGCQQGKPTERASSGSGLNFGALRHHRMERDPSSGNKKQQRRCTTGTTHRSGHL